MDGSSDPFEDEEPIVDSSWHSVRWSNHAMTSCGSSASWEWRYSNCSESPASTMALSTGQKVEHENRPPWTKKELKSDNCPNFQPLASASQEDSKTYQIPRPHDTLKSTRISLSETISGREKSILSLLFGFFDVSLHMRSVFKTLIFSNIKVLIFVETTKEKRFFFYASMNYLG